MHPWKAVPLACGLLGAAVVPLAVAQDTAAQDPPGFRVVSETVDVGEVIAGRVAEATFEFRNDTDADVRILRAAPS